MRVKQITTTLDQRTREEQLVSLAMITRNQYALDYWYGHLCTLKELPIYKHELKRQFGIITQEYTKYNAAVRSIFIKGEVDAYELLLDNAGEFHREVKKMVGYYEEAVRRVLGRTNLPNLDWLARLSTAKDLLDVVATADGYEAMRHTTLRPLLALGGTKETPYITDHHPLPSVMGHFTRLAGRINMLILAAYGRNEDVCYDVLHDADTMRTMEIASQNIVEAIMNYSLIATMFTDHGHTLEEAKQIMRDVEEREERRKADKAFTNTKLTNNK